MDPKILVIGAGPSAMSVLYHIEKLSEVNQGQDDKMSSISSIISRDNVICVEKQEDWGGLWNYTWRTGLDNHGEYVHGSMYRYLWSNGPKEASLEFPDYTFKQHFNKNIPSFPPREVLFDYIKGRWIKNDLRKYIRFSTVVRAVCFDEKVQKFVVTLKDLKSNVQVRDTFDYVINCSGHFSFPNVPSFPGFEKFHGRILHSHDFRDAQEFTGKNIVIVGSSYSAEDIAMQTVKYGAKSVVCSYRTAPMNFKWPDEITERPCVESVVNGNTVLFADGSSAEHIDAIILCTGYLHHYPYFMDDSLKLSGPNELYPDNLYKGTLWVKNAQIGNRLFYIGAQDQYNTWTMFDVQACWAVKVVYGLLTLPPTHEEMLEDIKQWRDRQRNLQSSDESIDFQGDFVDDLVKVCNYPYAKMNVAPLFHEWLKDKKEDILTYRDKQFTSIFDGVQSPAHHSSFMDALDDSMENYLR